MTGTSPSNGRKLENRSSPDWSDAGGCWLLLALVFFMSGAGFLLYAREARLAEERPGPDPRPVAVGAWISVAGGVALLARAASLHLAAARRRGDAARRPDEPWLSDRAWDRRTCPNELDRDSAVGLLFVGCLASFTAPFQAWTWETGGRPWVLTALVVLADIVLLILGAAALLDLPRLLRNRRSLASLRTFPVFLGSEFKADLRLPDAPRTSTAVDVTLRCIGENPPGPDGKPQTGCFSAWEETLAGLPIRSEIAVRFRLPDNPGLGTRLVTGSSRFWELEVATPDAARSDGTSSSTPVARFLVPVYAKPGGDRRRESP